MSLAATRFIATRAMTRKAPVQQQKRGIVDYLTNYPDRVRFVMIVMLLLRYAALVYYFVLFNALLSDRENIILNFTNLDLEFYFHSCAGQ
jgi:hypothetical protein